MPIKLYPVGTSLIGRRHRVNEDYYHLGENGLFIVADGVGGCPRGDVASRLACQIIAEYCNGRECQIQVMRQAFLAANEAIMSAADADWNLDEMATVATAVWVDRNSRSAFFVVGHIGDTRAYIIRSSIGEPRGYCLFQQLTADHNDGDCVTRCLGRPELVEGRVETYTDVLLPGDVILLCSDGFLPKGMGKSERQGEEEIKRALSDGRGDWENCCRHLAGLARERNNDDVTLVIIPRIE